jgi:hypothetical protein
VVFCTHKGKKGIQTKNIKTSQEVKKIFALKTCFRTTRFAAARKYRRLRTGASQLYKLHFNMKLSLYAQGQGSHHCSANVYIRIRFLTTQKRAELRSILKRAIANEKRRGRHSTHWKVCPPLSDSPFGPIITLRAKQMAGD